MLRISATLLACLLAGGCASKTGWTPTVDTYGSSRAQYLNRDLEDCRRLAAQASGGTGKETAKGAVVGGLFGAAAGAAIGAIVGRPGTGAAMGAAMGGFGGGAAKGVNAEETFKRSYRNCMRQRGHNVIN